MSSKAFKNKLIEKLLTYRYIYIYIHIYIYIYIYIYIDIYREREREREFLVLDNHQGLIRH